jgi:hypothetical protein
MGGYMTHQMLTPTSINNGTNNVFAGLVAGDYLFQVTDVNGCTYQIYSGGSTCVVNNGTATFE